MPRRQRKSFTAPDQVRRFANGRVDIVQLDETAIGRFVDEPGFRWSRDVAPVAGTTSCQHRHVGYAFAGQLQVQMDDGTMLELHGGEAFEIPPGHDAWVVGDVAWDSVEFTSARTFAESPEDSGQRVLATILFTDIVGSTAMLERLGDAAWRRLVLDHNERSASNSTTTGAVNSRRPETASSPSSTGLPGRSGRRRPSIPPSRISAYASGLASTPVKSSSSAARPAVWRSMRLLALRLLQTPERSS